MKRDHDEPDEIVDLPEPSKPEIEHEVKGGATPVPGGPIPVPYPNLTRVDRKAIVPCV